jgi:hypothetical protein
VAREGATILHRPTLALCQREEGPTMTPSAHSVKVELHGVYQAIYAVHKSGGLEHCWYQACECEKIWKAIKEDAAIRQQGER